MSLFNPSSKEIAEKIMTCFNKEQYGKFDRLLIKNRNNEELFDILLQNHTFAEYYLVYQPDDVIFQKLSIPIQKKLIECKPNLIRMASDEIRSDKLYMEDLQHRLDANELEDNHHTSVYEYLGSKLANDKEYLKSIQDKNPLAFLQAMKRVKFDEETVKNFFNKYPHYVRDLPDNLKYNYDYVVSLIEQIPAGHIEVYCSDMDFDYLKIEPIKQALIKLAGEKAYYRVLVLSLANNQSQLKKINPEEFKKLILLAPTEFFDVDRVQGLFSVGQQKSNINLIQKINKVARLHYKNIDTSQKLTVELYELSNAIGNNLTYESILQQVTQHWKQIQPWISQVDEWHELENGTLDNFEDNRSFYNIYNILIGLENNKLEDMFKIFINSELRCSEYAEGIKNINITEENLSFLQLACTCNLFNSDAKSIEMYNKIFLRISKWNSDPYTTLGFIDELSKDYNLNTLMSNVDIDSIDQDLLLNIFGYVNSRMNSICKISNLEELRNYQEFVKNNLENYRARTLEDYKHTILLKYFQIDLRIARDIVHSYLSANENSSLYQKMPEAKYLKIILERIINSGDIKDLNEINKSLENQETKISFKDIYKVLNNIKLTYGNELNSSLLKVNENTGIIDATNIDFNLLVHVIGAYGAVPPGDIYESWNTKENSSTVSICTSFISDNNMGIAPINEHSVVLGFNNLPDDFLEIMSCNDLYSMGFIAGRLSRFLNPDELKDNTRHGHNEIVIRRRKGKFAEEKIEPSYIICFDNVNEESKVAAEKFGVPIIFIDREKVAQRHHNEIVNMIEQFKTTFEPDLISKVICEQENNKAGLRLVRPDLVEKYFETEFRQYNIETIYTAIDIGLKNNNANAINAMNKFIKALEVEAEKFKITKETPHRKNTFDIDYDKFISVLKSNSAYNECFELPLELLSEELYEKFIQCRNRLAESERAELQYINRNEIEMKQSISSMKVM